MKNTDEIRRLLNGPRHEEAPAGRLLTLRAECDNEAADVLQSLREVWATVLWQTDPEFMGLDKWKMILPRWFVSKFDPEIAVEDPLLRRAFRLHEKMQPPEWTLAAWVRAFDPAVRRWSWWSAVVVAPHSLEVTVAIQGDAVDVEALNWVVRCAGARSVEMTPR